MFSTKYLFMSASRASTSYGQRQKKGEYTNKEVGRGEIYKIKKKERKVIINNNTEAEKVLTGRQ